ncbi:aminoglycoside phosphotransferase family protein [Aquabacterium sp.]|uniref:aminoglycoside phosphotransferase family protein n=1 Tax=Aquabacterium sp. TaxID=1872578 RepID=UPI002B7D7E40|nr:phosphotransferase [Aquabacterium sp.]HSW03138.1 phosphotransferase [Aquabacterium sp.]
MPAAAAPPSLIAWPDAQRETAFRAWLAPLCERFALDAASLAPASADASFRRYFRLTGARRSLIVMDAPPPQEDVRPFVDIAQRLQAAGLHAPEVLATDAEHGFVLLADLGQTLYLDALQTASTAQADALMRDAVNALVQLQQRMDTNGLPAYDSPLLQRELSLFDTWCVAREHNIRWTPAQHQQWQRICELLIGSALAQPQLAVHRDWMPRNLMVTEPNPGILDFQDAVCGPVTYDIASLLRDAFLSWDEDREIDWAVRWWQQARSAGLLAGHAMESDFGECWRALEWMGLQRHLKVLGIFCRLKHRDGKPRYSADLPRFFAYVTKVALRYRELKPLIALIEPMTGPLVTTGFTMR